MPSTLSTMKQQLSLGGAGQGLKMASKPVSKQGKYLKINYNQQQDPAHSNLYDQTFGDKNLIGNVNISNKAKNQQPEPVDQKPTEELLQEYMELKKVLKNLKNKQSVGRNNQDKKHIR